MQCQVCGARRPPQGPCPNCGAPPGRGAARGRGPSGASWGGSGQDWGRQGGGGGWDDYDDPDMGRPSGRHRRAQPDYGDVEYDRALVPSMDLSPAEMGAGMPGMPGVPGVPGMHPEDVERLLGIRRPVYIPATGNKRKFRVGSWRVISGVLSIVLVCLASCAVGTIFGKSYFSKISNPIKIASQATPPIDYSKVPATPVATMGPQGVTGAVGPKYISSVVTAKRVDSSNNPQGITSRFTQGDTVYLVVDVRNAPSGQYTVCVNWYLNGQFLQLPSSSETCATENAANYNFNFNLQYPQASVGMARVYWNRPSNDTNTGPTDPSLAASIIFGVYPPNPPTPTPIPPTPTKTPAASKTPAATKTP